MEFILGTLIIAAIAILAIILGIHSYYKIDAEKKEKKYPHADKRNDPPGKQEAGKDNFNPEPSKVVIRDTDSQDVKYAREHNMWVCACCETLNACPRGIRLASKEIDICPVEVTKSASTGLRGDLLKKADIPKPKSDIAEGELTCIACGKSQKVVYYKGA